ncbi:MAG TPA: glycosyltransferase family 4 protein [Bacteroidales bacterium]|nr:glycosyltransferase family 4 protein [Bacteroidales bacterium]
MKHILFIKLGGFSHINDRVHQQLSEKFPRFKVDTIDIAEFIDSYQTRKVASCFYLLYEYGWDFLTRNKSRYDYKSWEIVTSYNFRRIKKMIVKKIEENPGKYVFSFQTQSMFDGSSGLIPHFVYTDSTVLANRYYPGIDMKKVLKSKAWMRKEQQIYDNATCNFTFSTNQSRSLIDQYGIEKNKVECVFAGSNVIYNESDHVKKNYDTKNILFVGVNWERKGGDILFRSFMKVLETMPDATLTVVGCSPGIKHPNVEITGRIPLEEVEKYYQKASVFCMPTKQEPFGIVFVEAMQRKIPVVASNIGALPDMISNNYNGFIHEWDDVEGIAGSLCVLVSDPEKCRLFGERSYKIMQDKFTWDKTGFAIKKKIETFLPSLAGESTTEVSF